jgi:sec-independent protein translocase protein TatB
VFGVGIPEMLVIAIVAVLVFGPDRLPEFGRQAGQLVRQLRHLATNAQSELRRELGPEYADLRLSDLDPRQAIRRHILEAIEDEDSWNDDDDEDVLIEGEHPPYDSEAT